MYKTDADQALDVVTKQLEETERELEECRLEYSLLLATFLDDFRPATPHKSTDAFDLRGQFELTIEDIFNYCGDACDVVKSGQANVVELNKAIGKILAGGRLIAHLHRLSRLLRSRQNSSC